MRWPPLPTSASDDGHNPGRLQTSTNVAAYDLTYTLGTRAVVNRGKFDLADEREVEAHLSFGYLHADTPPVETTIRMTHYGGDSFEILPGQSVGGATILVTMPGVTGFSNWVPVNSTGYVPTWLCMNRHEPQLNLENINSQIS